MMMLPSEILASPGKGDGVTGKPASIYGWGVFCPFSLISPIHTGFAVTRHQWPKMSRFGRWNAACRGDTPAVTFCDFAVIAVTRWAGWREKVTAYPPKVTAGDGDAVTSAD